MTCDLPINYNIGGPVILHHGNHFETQNSAISAQLVSGQVKVLRNLHR